MGKQGDWSIVMTDFVASQMQLICYITWWEYRGEPEALNYLYSLKPHIIQHAKFLSTQFSNFALGESNIGIGNLSDAPNILVMDIRLRLYTQQMEHLIM